MRPYGLALYLPVAGTSMTVYWNGYKIHEAGNTQTGMPGFRTATVPIAFSERNDLIIDVANFDDRYGGLWHAPLIGNARELLELRKWRFLADGLVFGALVFLGLYALSVYFGTRRELYLYLGIFSLLLSVRTLIEGERIAHALIGEKHWYLLTRLTHVTFYAGNPVFYLYFKRLVGERRWRVWELLPLAVAAAYALLAIFTPPVFFTEFLNAALVAVLLLGIIALHTTVRAALRAQPGSRFALASVLVLLAAAANDALLHFAFTGSLELLPWALVLFVFANILRLEWREAQMRQTTAALAKSVELRRSSFERLVPVLARRFLQANSGKAAMFSAREKLPVRFAALFADLRGFTTLSEERSPAEIFALVNGYLARVVPPIMAEGGQVLEYQGDGILAYFPTGADHCLRAARAMQLALREAYETRELPDLRMGIALDFGSGLMTLLGNYQRLEPVVVSPAILHVQDIEALCAAYSVPIVFTYAFFQELSREAQAQAKLLTDLDDSPVFTLIGDQKLHLVAEGL
jgi:class 3 adenylate cyclase